MFCRITKPLCLYPLTNPLLKERNCRNYTSRSSFDNLQWAIKMFTRSCHRTVFHIVYSCSQLNNLCISQRSILIISHLKMYVPHCDILPKIVHSLLFPTFKLRVSSIQQAYFGFYYYCFVIIILFFILQGSHS
jgi:hypothetical protein